ncbi:DUF2634 domain-containing protein [Enterococcus faecalis]|uniref:DUF2634 domain-containing protein n=1 Tax=Enterococcus faecalis TaxID=1351 RepID=UPI000DBB0C9F|nr:DUF2634 domain-containing protein [Enterococcus faecalis]BBD24796.1 DUF2634 domain-containing protein [Enterococcus faecalis]BBD27837.1 DUF2634 domain-containing protein [Enterococcus faecalis]
MRDLKIVNGDLSFIDYVILLVEGDLELAQSVFMILSIRLEEFKLDTSVGLESDNMFGKNYNEDYLKQDITEAILDQEPRINSIENIEIVRNNRQLNITVEMLSTLGDEVEVVIRA